MAADNQLEIGAMSATPETIHFESKPTILIVDDELLNVMMLEVMLRKAGYATLSANTGQQARQIALEKCPSLVLLDVMMPGEDGITTCRILKSDPRTAGIPVIFLSGLSSSSDKVSGLAIGAVDYIVKPFEKVEVLARVELHLRIRDNYLALAMQQIQMNDKLRRAHEGNLVQPEDIPDARFAVCYRSVNTTGGDFYDVVPMGNGTHGYLVADLAGHDLEVSFSTSAVKALFRQSARNSCTPEETMQAINQGTLPLFQDGMHLTAAYIVLDRTLGRLTLVNGGHLPVILFTGDGRMEVVSTEGDILGVFDPATFSAVEHEVKAGDRFFLFTDGLVETPASGFGREKGIADLQAACRECAGLPLEKAVPAICSRIYPEGSSPTDDIILLGVEV